MTRGINEAVETQAQSEQNRPVSLYEIHLDGGLIWRYAGNAMQDVLFNGFTWTAAAVTHGDAEASTEPKIDEISISAENVTRQFTDYVSAGGEVNGYVVRVYRVFLDALEDPLNYSLEFEGEIDGLTLNAEAANVRVRRYQGTLAAKVPRRKCGPECPWPFKGTYCGYVGAELECDRSLARCIALNNAINFGGFPGVPRDDDASGV